MHSIETGGSTHSGQDIPPSSPRRPAPDGEPARFVPSSKRTRPSSGTDGRPRVRPLLRPLAVALAGGLLAGCQTLAPRPDAAQSADTALISPLAWAVIGDPADVIPPPLDVEFERRPLPRIQLDEVPDPAPSQLVERLRTSFELPDSDDAALTRELEYFAKHPDYVERVLNRARPYLHYITEQLEARGMPADLALLPIVESAYDPFAYSHGRAAGLWQIIPGTAKRLGVTQSWWFDGRRDVVQSTRAALDYLEMLHEMFDGDWLLAVAGYNSGEGNVSRALKRAAAAGRPGDFWGIRSYLPRETRTYVPRLLAIRNLVANAEQHGISLPEIPNTPYLAVVDTGGQIDMAVAAELAGLAPEEIYRLNAGVNRWATDPSGPHHMVLPLEHADRFTAAVTALPEEARVKWTRHRIRSGESLIALAGRYATTPAVLREVNGLKGNLIRAGDYLMIPHAHESYGSYSLSADARLASTQNRERAGERVVHKVRRGDSLWSISRGYGVNVRSLASWNGMAPGDTLAVGRELVVWVGDGAVPIRAAASVAAASPLNQNQTRQVNYTVRRGDSLSSIASRFRVSVSELLQWNNGVSTSRYLQPGDRLVMHVNVAEQST